MIKEPSVNYAEKDLVRLAHRDNNTKRPWLLVNPLQGKHIPCSPGGALSMFSHLAYKLYQTYENERLLIVGFAETATAIGAAIAAYSSTSTSYIPTTREEIPGGEYLYFSESHSHATEQRLVKNRLRTLLEQADRLIFAEDEVTTGNTILNAVDAISREYGPLPLKYGVVSILNGMTPSHFAAFAERDISFTYLHHLDNEAYSNHLTRYEYDPALCFTPCEDPLQPEGIPGIPSNTADEITTVIGGYENPRLGIESDVFLNHCKRMVESIVCHVKKTAPEEDLRNKDILVLGTEEFMFPPLYLAARLEESFGCRSVRFHATTRSPILPSNASDYPIFSRFSLRSVYDSQRPTFIYNLARYDKVIILHDSRSDALPGLRDLYAALAQEGCTDISVYKWSD